MLKNKDAYLKCPPAFQMYATDTLANKEFRLMSFAERGVFITLYMECWVNGEMPADENQLARLLNIPKVEIENKLSPHVLYFFKVQDGKITSPELDKYKQELIERRLKQIEGGKKGNKIKKGNLEGNLVGNLVGSEKSRDEESREESIYEGYLEDESLKSWVEEYENS
jgi:uncharacterized protein YdaU (DUF1376 family)